MAVDDNSTNNTRDSLYTCCNTGYKQLHVQYELTENKHMIKQGENPCHVLLVLLGLMSAPHCTHVRAALVSIKESS